MSRSDEKYSCASTRIAYRMRRVIATPPVPVRRSAFLRNEGLLEAGFSPHSRDWSCRFIRGGNTMSISRYAAVALAVVAGVIVMPNAAYAQSAIAGVVKDTSGAVLPGVTVEAASPALIEKTRTVATDNEGQYKIIDLRPGPYTVTLSVEGFNRVVREGIELPANFTAVVIVELKVGSLSETITVSGGTPIVDVQSAL